MSGFKHDQVRDCVLNHCGKSLGELAPSQFQDLTMMLANMHGAASVWQKPSAIEDQLEAVRAKLLDAMTAVKSMDNYAKALARKEADRDRDTNFQKQILALQDLEMSEDERRQQIGSICANWNPQPQAEWVDNAALSAMDKLRESLVWPIEKAIPNTRTGPGRPANRRAYLVAEFAYVLYVDLAEQEPGFWDRGETPFSRLVSELYKIYGIRAGIKKPILSAMHKFKKTD
jgi:hypothetical protein